MRFVLPKCGRLHFIWKRGEGERLRDLAPHSRVKVILQILAHAREIEMNIDPLPLEFGFWSNSGKHQQLR